MTISEQKLQILSLMSFHNLSLRNIFVLGPLRYMKLNLFGQQYFFLVLLIILVYIPIFLAQAVFLMNSFVAVNHRDERKILCCSAPPRQKKNPLLQWTTTARNVALVKKSLFEQNAIFFEDIHLKKHFKTYFLSILLLKKRRFG